MGDLAKFTFEYFCEHCDKTLPRLTSKIQNDTARLLQELSRQQDLAEERKRENARLQERVKKLEREASLDKDALRAAHEWRRTATEQLDQARAGCVVKDNALLAAKQKLGYYRAQHSGEYIGGMEYTALLSFIDAALSKDDRTPLLAELEALRKENEKLKLAIRGAHSLLLDPRGRCDAIGVLADALESNEGEKFLEEVTALRNLEEVASLAAAATIGNVIPRLKQLGEALAAVKKVRSK